MDLFDQREYQDAPDLFERVLKALPGDGPAKMFIDLCRKGLAGDTDDLRPEYKKSE